MKEAGRVFIGKWKGLITSILWVRETDGSFIQTRIHFKKDHNGGTNIEHTIKKITGLFPQRCLSLIIATFQHLYFSAIGYESKKRNQLSQIGDLWL